MRFAVRLLGATRWRDALSWRAVPSLPVKNGKRVMGWNTPGGDNQPQAMLQASLNVVEFGMNVEQALEQPTVTTTSLRPTMFSHQPGDKLIIPKSLADRVGAALAAK